MPSTPVGSGPKAAPPTPPTTPARADTTAKRGWETARAKPQAPPTPPATPPASDAASAPTLAWRRAAGPQTQTFAAPLQSPGPAFGAAGFVRAKDAAGHAPLTAQARARLSPEARNMHDHWFGRHDRQFSTHASEFESLSPPIDSWETYQVLAREVVQQQAPTTSRVLLGNGKTRHYDAARNLLVLTAPTDGHIVTMFRPGLNQMPEAMRPSALAPLAQGERYANRMR